ncbi:MAG: Na/Pi cotransporter family protein [Pseudobdellovibrionaceae bacterium]
MTPVQIELGSSYFMLLFFGLALFLFGLQNVSQPLEKIMVNRITKILNRLSQNRFLSMLVGVVLTTLLQSSGAVTSMLVGLGSAKVINLKQVMGIIIGTAIGSTLTVQLISLDMGQYAFPLFIFSFAVYFRTKNSTVKHTAQVFMGIALVFFAMNLISASSHHFAENVFLKDLFITLRENRGYSLLASMIFCALVQSSAITIGLAMTLAQAGAISFYDAMIWVYGANIGTTSVALVAAGSSNYIGKQVAWAHFFYKTLSVLIFYPFTSVLIDFLSQFDTTVARSVANAHLVFNLLSAAVFYPFVNVGALFIEKLFPKSASDEFGVEFLQQNTYKNSALAVSFANREIMRTADIVVSMIKDSIKLFEKFDPVLLQSIKDRDNQVDFLYRETKMFLLDHANKSEAVVHQNVMSMIMFLSDVERAADSIDINITALAIKKSGLKIEFSPEGLAEILELHSQVCQLTSMAISAFQNKDMCPEVIKMKRDLTKVEMIFREHHIERLNRGIRETINTSSIHLDLLSEYRRIGSLMTNHAYSHK